MPAGQRTQALVEMVDLMPTLLQLTGLTIHDAAELEGISLVPLLQLSSAPGQARQALDAAAHWKNATFTCYPRCATGLKWIFKMADCP